MMSLLGPFQSGRHLRISGDNIVAAFLDIGVSVTGMNSHVCGDQGVRA
ncbi:hypothetical protein ABIC02_007864 [Bradyrhizobium sp. RT5a]